MQTGGPATISTLTPVRLASTQSIRRRHRDLRQINLLAAYAVVPAVSNWRATCVIRLACSRMIVRLRWRISIEESGLFSNCAARPSMTFSGYPSWATLAKSCRWARAGHGAQLSLKLYSLLAGVHCRFVLSARLSAIRCSLASRKLITVPTGLPDSQMRAQSPPHQQHALIGRRLRRRTK
jgi:hypothetical protein